MSFVMVKLAPTGRVLSFTLAGQAVDPPPVYGDQLVVQTEGGLALGMVLSPIPALGGRRDPAGESPNKVLRRATPEDLTIRVAQRHRELEAYRLAILKIRERGLEMKLTRVEQMFDGSRLIFYFTAEARVDFRELVRELAGEFRTRIEMRQIGARDEAKLLSGYGSCGLPLCCSVWLNAFEPVSIKMAKQQDLSLNPSRLSGLCGRLKCCLRYELPAGAGTPVTRAGSGDDEPARAAPPCGRACGRQACS
jgi:cell fate regulator YaaT (PSP1 superfamily)